jgi:diguanylate cyclase (GGDEF)-like protein
MSEFSCSGCGKPSTLMLKAMQHEALEGVARSLPLETIMTTLCLQAERLASDAVCSILSVDAEGRLRHLAAPSLPEPYSAAIDGLKIGPAVGSCGKAAFFGEAVEVTDIATDPLWAEFKALALPLGLRACWSSPIHSSDGRVVATFAFYYRTCRGPSVLERAIVNACVNLCAIALEQEERKANIERLVYFDPLTGVPNRLSFERYGRHALATARESNSGLNIYWIDLDDFKTINDTFGRHAGDAALKIVAERISATLQSGEYFARIGGDEFVVVQSSALQADIEDLAQRVTEALSQPMKLGETIASINASIGIARVPEDGADLPELMKKADLALFEAKTRGRKTYLLFDRDIEARIASNWQMKQDLRLALARDEFELHFQPIVGLTAFDVSGFEALLRWRRPGHGLLSPAIFLEAAEKIGLICDIGEWVLREACALGALLPPTTRIAVNLSPTQLAKPGFALDVAKIVSEHDILPQQLELEITESALLLENDATFACLSDLRQLGAFIALDDFGTGFSALSHLRAFPVDRLKIDRSFVSEVDISPETASITRAIIGLARELGVKTTAEGIETLSQLRALHSFGCDEIQGFLVSRPKPLHAFLGDAGASEPRGAAARNFALAQ